MRKNEINCKKILISQKICTLLHFFKPALTNISSNNIIVLSQKYKKIGYKKIRKVDNHGKKKNNNCLWKFKI